MIKECFSPFVSFIVAADFAAPRCNTGAAGFIAPAEDEPVMLLQCPLRSCFADLSGFKKDHGLSVRGQTLF